MKKSLIIAFISFLLTASAFAEGKRYIIDLADTTNGQLVTIKKNPYSTNFQNVNPPTFTKFFEKRLPRPGDIVEVHYKLKSSADIPALTMAIVDNSPAAKYWLNISNQYESVNDIVAGVSVEGVLKYRVVAQAISEVTVQLMYDDEINSIITIQRAGVRTCIK